MVIASNLRKDAIDGKVLRITFEKPGVKYLEFELSNGEKCFCRGNAAPGKDFRDLTTGANVKLFGKWGVSNNPKYKSMGEQFNFSDYVLLSAIDKATHKTPAVTSSPAKEASTEHQEEVRGSIVRFRPFTSDYRIFLLHAIDGRELWCQGTIDSSNPPYESNKVRLVGNWRVNPRRPEYGKQFYFTSCDIIPSDKPEKVIRRPRMSNPTMTSTIAGDNVAEKVATYLKAIGGKKITYEFHSPKHASIVAHVTAQLKERVIHANREDKDLFFLTALLDRNVEDKIVQAFRNTHRTFKKDLLRCWEEAEGPLVKATGDIRRALVDETLLREISKQSPAYRRLAPSIPGDDGTNQLLACLKIIRDLYNRSENSFISDFLKDMKSEREIRTYLRSIYGIGPKLANWSLTNVTGHWFVIDEPHIKPLIEKDLADALPAGMAVSLDNADTIFEYWFGKFDETSRQFEGFSQSEFAAAFPDFPVEACEFLPFIVTQCLWFFDLFYGDGTV
jgi:hypothetical protein